MKKTSLYFILPALMLWVASNVYAASCQHDFNEIVTIVKRRHYIVTKKNIVIGSVSGPVVDGGDNVCGAPAKTAGASPRLCNIFWMKGDWRSQLVSAPR
ncbi:hypothetical protein [Candidatus Sororendozoicomonas aggregata]|uniref:hypothetical protein n=1 Tax=Candidatus Sororendozoicomonas aggregata TaxID=3073239 RepID=UPI002ED4B5AE